MADGPSRRSTLLPGLLLAALVAAAYGGSLRNQYVFDDLMIVRDDPRVRSLHESPRLFVEPLWGYASAGNRPHLHQYYRPLQTFPLAVFFARFGEEAWPAHLFSLLLHWLNCLLLFFIMQRILERPHAARGGQTPAPDAAWKPALLCAALFAVHPGLSEAVLWVSDLAGLGAAFCILSIFALHLSGRAASAPGWLGTGLLFLAGLWFKESGVFAPILPASHDLLFGRRWQWSRLPHVLWRYAAFVPPLILYLHLRRSALGGLLPGFASVPLTGWELLLNAVALVPNFVRTFLWPFAPNMYHDFAVIHGVASLPFLFGAGVLLAGTLLFLLGVKTHRPVAFGLLWSIITAAPHLLVRWPQLNVFGERYLYLPAAGIFVALSYCAQRLAAHRRLRSVTGRLAVAMVAALMTAFLVTDIRRAADWRDNLTLYRKTIRQSQRAELIRINLAVQLLERKRYEEGIGLLEELVDRDPSWPSAWHNLGLLYLGKGEDGRARHAFEQALGLDRRDRKALLNLGYVHDRMGQRDEAVRTYLQLLQLDRRSTQAWYNLAVVAFEEQQFGNASRALGRVLAMDPQDRQAAALHKRLKSAAQRRPGTAAPGATPQRCEQARQALEAGRFQEAILRLKAAAWLDEASPLPHQYLANVYYLKGRLGPAIRHQRKALRRDPDNQLYRRNLESLQAALAAP